jgi:arsenate reductase
MAEAWLRHYAGDRFEVYSGGLDPKGINPYTIQVMEARGIDMSAHHSKGLKQFLGVKNFSFLITVCSNAEENCPIFPGVSKRLYWPFEDPAAFEGSHEAKLAKFIEVRDQIEAKVQAWLVELEHQSAS